MSGTADDEYQRLVSRFWHNYLSLQETTRSLSSLGLVCKHVEEYISACQGAKLQQYLQQHIDVYRSAKGRMTTLPE